MERATYDWTLAPEIEARLGESSYGRQRAICEAGQVLLVLHTPPSGDDAERSCVVFLRTVEGDWLCNGRPDGEFRFRKLLQAYGEAIEAIDGEYDKADSARDLFGVLGAAAPLNRAADHLHAAVQSARQHVAGDTFLIAMRDWAYDLARQAELLFSEAKMALDCRLAEAGEREAAETRKMALAQHKLNVLAAITFPLLSVATIFGMNFDHGVNQNGSGTFWLILIVGLAIGLATKKWVTRDRG